MALTANVESKLKQLFREKKECLVHNRSIEEGLQNYFKYRNLICEEIYKNTLDLSAAKKLSWWNQFRLDEGDSISIISDSIFKSIDTYDETKKNKFVTFFYKVMNSTLKNHLKYLTAKRKTSFFNEASYKDAAEKNYQKTGIKHKKTHVRNIEQLNTLSDALMQEHYVNLDSVMNARFSVRHMLRNVQGKEKGVLIGLLKGRTNKEIAKKIKTSPRYVGMLVEKIQKKFRQIESELCQNENQ